MWCGCRNKVDHVISASQLSITVTKHLRPSTALFLKFPALVLGPIAPGPMALQTPTWCVWSNHSSPHSEREVKQRKKKNGAVSHQLFDWTPTVTSIGSKSSKILAPSNRTKLRTKLLYSSL